MPAWLGFPSDDAVIRVAGGGGAHVTVGKDGHVFGLRRGGGGVGAAAAADVLPWEFVASFGASGGGVAGGACPEARLSIAQGPAGTVRRGGPRAGTVIATAACDGGLVVEACSGGWVRQRYVEGGGGGVADPAEEWRTVTGSRGTVVRALRDGRRQVLSGDGATAWYVPGVDGGGAWHATAPSGVRSLTRGGGGAREAVAGAPLTVHEAVDAASGARVRVRYEDDAASHAEAPEGLLSPAGGGGKRLSPRAAAGNALRESESRSVRSRRSVDEAFVAATDACVRARAA